MVGFAGFHGYAYGISVKKPNPAVKAHAIRTNTALTMPSRMSQPPAAGESFLTEAK